MTSTTDQNKAVVRRFMTEVLEHQSMRRLGRGLNAAELERVLR